jgi:SNF2 family DNA or RNA helicase
LRSIGGVTQPKEAVKTTAFHNVMMELRKICGHPYLTDPDIEPKNLEESAIHQALVDACGKLKLLQVMLHKLRSRGHRVLIFSQFKLVLNILEDFLNGEGMTYFRLV